MILIQPRQDGREVVELVILAVQLVELRAGLLQPGEHGAELRRQRLGPGRGLGRGQRALGGINAAGARDVVLNAVERDHEHASHGVEQPPRIIGRNSEEELSISVVQCLGKQLLNRPQHTTRPVHGGEGSVRSGRLVAGHPLPLVGRHFAHPRVEPRGVERMVPPRSHAQVLRPPSGSAAAHGVAVAAGDRLPAAPGECLRRVHAHPATRADVFLQVDRQLGTSAHA